MIEYFGHIFVKFVSSYVVRGQILEFWPTIFCLVLEILRNYVITICLLEGFLGLFYKKNSPRGGPGELPERIL